MARIRPQANSTQPLIEDSIALAAKRIDQHRAQLELYLDEGQYAFVPKVTSGHVQAYGAPSVATVTSSKLPAIALVKQTSQPKPDGTAVRLSYYGPNDELVWAVRTTEELEKVVGQAKPTPPQRKAFVQVMRQGAFKWQQLTQKLNTVVTTNDQKKRVVVDNLRFDPFERTYHIAVQSLVTHTIYDTITLQALGPNNVVIYQQEFPITIDPQTGFAYDFAIPADRGAVHGLHIVVHDPLDFSHYFDNLIDYVFGIPHAIIQAVKDKVTEKAASITDFIDNLPFEVSLFFTPKFEVLVFEIKIIEVSIQCRSGGYGCYPVKVGGLFGVKSVGDIIKEVASGLRNYVRKIMPDDKSFEQALGEIIAKGLNVGGINLTVLAGVNLTYPFLDVNGCPPGPALDAAKESVKQTGQALKDVFEFTNFKLKSEVEQKTSIFDKLLKKIKIPVFSNNIQAQINRVYNVSKFSADATPDKTGFQLDVGFEYGFKGEFRLIISYLQTLVAEYGSFDKALEAVGLLQDLVIQLQGDKAVGESFRIFELIGQLALVPKINVGGGCGSNSGAGKNFFPKKRTTKKAPNVNGNPDDRQDFARGDSLQMPTGTSGELQMALDKLHESQRLGLSRAELFYTYRVRQLQMRQFLQDDRAADDFSQELNLATTRAISEARATLSNTLPISVSDIFTDVLGTAYREVLLVAQNSQYNRTETQLTQDLAFAQRRYFELLGQELELQLELRQLESQTLAVLDEGLSDFAESAIGSLGFRPTLIQIVPGVYGTTGRGEYVTPFEAPRVLVIPSGGLYPHNDNDTARLWLEQYVAGGGTLIVLAQYENEDWNLLPGGQVRGLGYKDDILCKDASVRIINPSEYTIGIDRDLPNLQIDGSFTSFPQNATVVLMRTTGNQMPAMIEYPFGAGRVIATSAYPDFYINGMQSDDDVNFARSLFGVAFLKASNQQVFTTVNSGQTVQFSTRITNTNILSATNVTTYRDHYDNRINESWRWAAHAPTYRSFGVTSQPLAAPIPPQPIQHSFGGVCRTPSCRDLSHCRSSRQR
ncbi:MAG: hypothetical protein HC853_03470 [Anaerolineae bacterium]|nr:hypothetical protein [Anaerolineae bacterium]